MSARLRVMLADDHAMVRMGFRMLLASHADIEVVAEAEDGERAYQQYEQVKPDVLVMDLSMPGMGGLEALRRLTARDAQARVLVLSAHEDSAHPRRALKAGALGYVCKRSAPEELVDAVRSVAAGRLYLGAELARRLALQDLNGGASPVEQLSEREFAVFLRLAQGESVAQIAEVLHLSANTVGTHLYNIKQKLGASNQAELTLIAVRNGLLDV
ncbi:two-component system, NarL family, invasion response regulator UvrY [Solimonas aquatica]|uniref:Two-component system, NarL family, invasion response regulator UvrY n=1 Tax=Solimonas aquatica TaxID=489703 RepID=A0A1H9GNA2_9GAMM|nr:response regulator transcription factor [Solimonas aquatica]SEQ51617.1 two-component system, NarL family, invasion response regulator UvrY [Solimonas aquatica]